MIVFRRRVTRTMVVGLSLLIVINYKLFFFSILLNFILECSFTFNDVHEM